ncbi:hypothetical protein QBC38DRAFT_445732 [Podospora fimiseda]|uniref:GPI anchored protein n=1 Tax=Podospora fimiseda TaxID=252190 RepID=A0AAN7BKU6_9PEZI|nr:hypothetical protein QBC38DRAFT_445732 [Podospora fimiseda]
MLSNSLLAIVAAASTALGQSTETVPVLPKTSTGTRATTTSSSARSTTTTSIANPNTTIALFVPEPVIGAATPTVFANVLGSDAAATTYSIECRGGRSAGAPCGLIHNATVTVGASRSSVNYFATERTTVMDTSPKTFHNLIVTAICDINSGTATCIGTSRSATATEYMSNGVPIAETTVNQDIRHLSTTAVSSGGHVIAITVIPDRFPGATKTGSGAPSATITTRAGGNQGGNGVGNGYNTPTPSSGGSSGAVQTPASRGAAPRMTQGVTVAGVLAAVGGVVALL